MKKRMIALLMTVLMIFAIGTTVFAGSWQNDGYGWWYLNDDGSYPASQWMYDGGAWYHFNGYGYMDTGWIWDGYNWYYMNPDGTMATGWVWDGYNWYYMNDDGTMYTGWLFDNGNAYYFLNSGTMATGWAWVPYYENPDKSNWSYFDANGVSQSGWILDGGTWYYLYQRQVCPFQGVWRTQWSGDTTIYYLDDRQVSKSEFDEALRIIASYGMLATNDIQPEGSPSETYTWYAIDGNGAWYTTPGWYYMAEGSYVGEPGTKNAWFYVRDDGLLVRGWLQVDGIWYYFYPFMFKGAATSIDNQLYLFDENGALQETPGWHFINDAWYYIENGICATGWREIDGKQYYFEEMRGTMVCSQSTTINGKYYTFDANGQVLEVKDFR